MKHFITLLCIILFSYTLLSQDEPVINSNFLVEHGISPKVLDAAFNSFLQDGSFTQNMEMELIAGKEADKKAAKLEMIYDPSFQQGLDIRFVFDPNLGLVIKRKKLKNLAEATTWLFCTPLFVYILVMNFVKQILCHFVSR